MICSRQIGEEYSAVVKGSCCRWTASADAGTVAADASNTSVPNALTKLPIISQKIVSAQSLTEDDTNQPIINRIRYFRNDSTISKEADQLWRNKANMLVMKCPAQKFPGECVL